MKISGSQRNIIFFTLLALLFGFLGVKIGSILYHYEPFAKGVLGGSILYLLWSFYIINPKPSSNQFAGLFVEFPRDFKYVMNSFFVAIIGYLSIVYIGEAVSYLLKFISAR
jgi:hypothetical protein